MTFNDRYLGMNHYMHLLTAIRVVPDGWLGEHTLAPVTPAIDWAATLPQALMIGGVDLPDLDPTDGGVTATWTDGGRTVTATWDLRHQRVNLKAWTGDSFDDDDNAVAGHVLASHPNGEIAHAVASFVAEHYGSTI